MSFSEVISPLVGRWALAWFFLYDAYARANGWDGSMALLTAKAGPLAPLVLVVAIMVMALGGLALVLGYHAQHGAMLLFGYTIVVTMVMHDYWHIDNDALARAAQFNLFARNIAIAGALLMVAGMGAGPLSIDNRRKRR